VAGTVVEATVIVLRPCHYPLSSPSHSAAGPFISIHAQHLNRASELKALHFLCSETDAFLKGLRLIK
jgi:hypothetical protein